MPSASVPPRWTAPRLPAGIAVGLALLAAPLALAAQLPRPAEAPAFAFENVRVVDVGGDRAAGPGSVSGPRTVLVEDGVITAVGPAGSVPLPAGAVRIDGTGRYLMPGLAEMHAHVPPVPQGRPPQALLEEYMFLYLANGITTIRGMLGSPYQIELKGELERGEIPGPRFYPGAPSINGNTAPTPDDAEALMREAAQRGYDLMKIHPGVPREAWDRMVAVADEVGLSFGGHIPAGVGLEHALATGITTVDHLDGYLEAAASPLDPPFGGQPPGPAGIMERLDEGRLVELADRTAEAGAFAVPTQYLWENLYGERSADEALALPEMRYVSPQQRNAWRQQAAGRPQVDPAVRAEYLAARDLTLRLLADRDVVMMGTDSPQLFNVPGFALHREIDEMADAGMTPEQILRSGTTAVGRYLVEVLGEAVTLGRVAEGYDADLVLLEGNPLEDLSALRERSGVMIRGRWLDAPALDAGLAEIAGRHAN